MAATRVPPARGAELFYGTASSGDALGRETRERRQAKADRGDRVGVHRMLSAGQVITNACMHSSDVNGWKTLSHSVGGGTRAAAPPLAARRGLSAACVALRSPSDSGAVGSVSDTGSPSISREPRATTA